jgi:antitoxin (DNA-binding transcriptional repressor) of toxin-antitoxin stability system
MLTVVDICWQVPATVDSRFTGLHNESFTLAKEHHMKMIAIRDLRASLLHELAAEKQLAGITDHRVLVGVFTPIDREWLIHVLTQNHSRLLQSVRDGEKELDNLGSTGDVRTLEDRLKEASAKESESTAPSPPTASTGWDPLEAVQPLLNALNTVRNMAGHQPQEKPQTDARSISIRDLSANEIRTAANAGQMLIVTDRRQPVGIIIPVTQRLVAYLIEANLSRLKHSVTQGEREYQTGNARSLAEILSTTAGV